jgi:hypothetical protein
MPEPSKDLRMLAGRYFILLGRPREFTGIETERSWSLAFEAALDKYSYKDLDAAIVWMFKENPYWLGRCPTPREFVHHLAEIIPEWRVKRLAAEAAKPKVVDHENDPRYAHCRADRRAKFDATERLLKTMPPCKFGHKPRFVPMNVFSGTTEHTTKFWKQVMYKKTCTPCWDEAIELYAKLRNQYIKEAK